MHTLSNIKLAYIIIIIIHIVQSRASLYMSILERDLIHDYTIVKSIIPTTFHIVYPQFTRLFQLSLQTCFMFLFYPILLEILASLVYFILVQLENCFVGLFVVQMSQHRFLCLFSRFCQINQLCKYIQSILVLSSPAHPN